MSEEPLEDNELEDPLVAIDVAERLINLMRKIETHAQTLKLSDPTRPMNTVLALHCPLHHAFEPLAKSLGFSDYADLRDNFVILCNRVVRDIDSLSLNRPSTKDRWINAAATANSVFDASNFAEKCQQVFNRHFSTEVYERLEDASERLVLVNRKETSQGDLKDALEAARATMDAYEENGDIPEEINRILKHYLQQIEASYERYNDFGEQAFWATYKEYFATFVQVHPIIMPEETGEEAKKAVKDAMIKMHNKMFYGLQALSITADVATLGAASAALLKLAN